MVRKQNRNVDIGKGPQTNCGRLAHCKGNSGSRTANGFLVVSSKNINRGEKKRGIKRSEPDGVGVADMLQLEKC